MSKITREITLTEKYNNLLPIFFSFFNLCHILGRKIYMETSRKAWRTLCQHNSTNNDLLPQKPM